MTSRFQIGCTALEAGRSEDPGLVLVGWRDSYDGSYARSIPYHLIDPALGGHPEAGSPGYIVREYQTFKMSTPNHQGWSDGVSSNEFDDCLTPYTDNDDPPCSTLNYLSLRCPEFRIRSMQTFTYRKPGEREFDVRAIYRRVSNNTNGSNSYCRLGKPAINIVKKWNAEVEMQGVPANGFIDSTYVSPYMGPDS